MHFEKIAPYLHDPLVLAGFFLLLFFGFARIVVKQGLIPTLTKASGYRVLQAILLYGFILGLLVLLLGFGFKFRELSTSEQQNAVGMLHQELRSNMDMLDQLAKNTQTMLGLAATIAQVIRDQRFPALAILFPAKNLDVHDSAVIPGELARSALLELKQRRLDRSAQEWSVPGK